MWPQMGPVSGKICQRTFQAEKPNERRMERGDTRWDRAPTCVCGLSGRGAPIREQQRGSGRGAETQWNG